MLLECTEDEKEIGIDASCGRENILASQFNADGYVVAENIFPESAIDNALALALNNFSEVHELIDKKGFEFGIGIKHGFKEIVQRHPERYEMPYKMDDPRFDFVLTSEPIRRIVSRILQCGDYIIANRSLVISSSGCVDQAWHTDGPHMSATTDLPCHCLNVFVPLVDITSLNGPTEFRPGSQFYTRDLAKSMLIAKLKKQLRPVDAPEVKRGSVLLVSWDIVLVI
jgi:ectoine hydroxylase-related dioxygenase (phytanoyl-CoA dioxygenase family)